MCLALVAFAWMWWQTHRRGPERLGTEVVTIKQTSGVGSIGAAPPDDGGSP